jgi:hypothetical protein
MLQGATERSSMMRTDKLAATWDGFLRLTPGERRVFLGMLRDWHLQRRIAVLAARGHHYPYHAKTFADLTLDGADLAPLARPALAVDSEADFASLDLSE